MEHIGGLIAVSHSMKTFNGGFELKSIRLKNIELAIGEGTLILLLAIP